MKCKFLPNSPKTHKNWFFILTTSFPELHTRSGTCVPKCEGTRHTSAQNVSKYKTLLELLDSFVCDFFPMLPCNNPVSPSEKEGWRKFHLLMHLISSSAEKKNPDSIQEEKALSLHSRQRQTKQTVSFLSYSSQIPGPFFLQDCQ